MTHAETRMLKADIIAYRMKGHTKAETAEHYRVNKEYVRNACRGIKYDWVRDVDAMSAGGKRGAEITAQKMDRGISKRESKAAATIACEYLEWEYVRGFKCVDGHVILRHKLCDSESEQSYVSIRHHRQLTCPHCKRREEEARKNAEAVEKERSRIAKEMKGRKSSLHPPVRR